MLGSRVFADIELQAMFSMFLAGTTHVHILLTKFFIFLIFFTFFKFPQSSLHALCESGLT